MSNTAKLKKRAAELEAKKQYDKALEFYEQALSTARAADEERDVPLYNRVGDLHYRIGNSEEAISYYEQAADLYAEGGFFNNAIALCNKILRYSPGRTIIYYKLGIISAKKGFNSDAKQNFLEYADRMQRVGKMDEAFRALKEFADLCPGQDDVRLMLAEQLARADRKSEALEQLEALYDTLQAESRSTEAAATLERMKALDPSFKPRKSTTPTRRKKEGLVFLDLDFEVSPHAQTPEGEPPEISPRAPKQSGTSSAAPSQRVHAPTTQAPAAQAPTPELPIADVASAPPAADGAVEGLEPTSLSADPSPRVERMDEFQSHPSNELVFITPPEESDIDADADAAQGEVPAAPVSRAAAEPASDAEHAPSKHERSWAPAPDDEFVDLGEWLERNRTPISTRMVTHDEAPEDDEQKDFAEMLNKFKAGISRNVDEEDFESHYDLGIAFREMGLLDEAIGSFQKAARGPDQLLRASEAIGECFMDKGEASVTIAVLERLLRGHSLSDAQLVGVLYLLGRAAETLARHSDAAAYYHRVLAVQIGFRDTASRLSALAQAAG